MKVFIPHHSKNYKLISDWKIETNTVSGLYKKLNGDYDRNVKDINITIPEGTVIKILSVESNKYRDVNRVKFSIEQSPDYRFVGKPKLTMYMSTEDLTGVDLEEYK